MKAALVVILFAISALAQNQTEPNQPAEAACGLPQASSILKALRNRRLYDLKPARARST